MHTYLALAVLALTSQLGGTDSRYNNPASPSETEKAASPAAAAPAWDYAPVTPPEGAASPLPGKPHTQTAPPAATRAAAPAATEVKPSDLWKALTTQPTTGQLTGSPLTLAEAVSGANSRAEQTARVAAYWELSAAIVDYYLALRESTELETLRKSVSRPSFAWDEARLAQTARIESAKGAAETAQYRLQRLMHRPVTGELALTSDTPHSGAYETRYEQNFAGHDSPEALELSELLPHLHQQLRNEATSLAADQQALQSVSQQRDPQSDGAALLKTYELVTLRRREFAKAVAEYNIQIARYSELATPGQVGTNRLVAMLIDTGNRAALIGRDSEVTRTSAEEPIESQPRQVVPRTFAPDNRATPQTTQAQKPGQERSILVQPQ